MIRSKLAHGAVALGIAAACAACRDKGEDAYVPAPTGPLPSLARDAGPRDHLGPGELVEGSEKIFGLPLPRGFAVKAAYNDYATASGSARATDVANFIRARVPSRSTTIGAASTIFEHVQTPLVPGHDLMVRVEPLPEGNGTLVTVRDVTPPPMVPGISEEDRWHEAGLTPEGRILDPKHLH